MSLLKTPKFKKNNKKQTPQDRNNILTKWLEMGKENSVFGDKQQFQRRMDKLTRYINLAKELEKQNAERARFINEFKELQSKVPVYVPEMHTSPKKNPMLNCHMADDDMEEAFCKHKELLDDIFNGKTHSDRHEEFHDVRHYSMGVWSSLCNNMAIDAFTRDQLMWFSTKLNEHFGDTVDYQMKVLLPELLLQIFMDKHKMSKEQALKYLEYM